MGRVHVASANCIYCICKAGHVHFSALQSSCPCKKDGEATSAILGQLPSCGNETKVRRHTNLKTAGEDAGAQIVVF